MGDRLHHLAHSEAFWGTVGFLFLLSLMIIALVMAMQLGPSELPQMIPFFPGL